MEKLGIAKFDYFRTYYVDGAPTVGKYGMPLIKGTKLYPHDVISCTELSSHKDDRKKLWVDHFVDDNLFDYAWKNLDHRLELYRQFEGVIGFDFSLDNSFQLSQNIWHCAKNRNADYYLQQNGICNLIPVVSWIDRTSFDWCLDGLPSDSTLAVSNNGCFLTAEGLKEFIYGINVIEERLTPYCIVICGQPIDNLDKFDNLLYYPSRLERWKCRRRNNGR